MSKRRYTKVCEGCNQEFIAKRIDARYCSPNCRSFEQYSRKIASKLEASKKPVTDKKAKGGNIEPETLPNTIDTDRLERIALITRVYKRRYDTNNIMLFDGIKPPSLTEFIDRYINDEDFIEEHSEE